MARPFRPHLPAVDFFPLELWSRLVARRARKDDALWLDGADVTGYRPLREALVAHLKASRAISTTADHIVIVPSLQQVLMLVSRLVLEPGDPV